MHILYTSGTENLTVSKTRVKCFQPPSWLSYLYYYIMTMWRKEYGEKKMGTKISCYNQLRVLMSQAPHWQKVNLEIKVLNLH